MKFITYLYISHAANKFDKLPEFLKLSILSHSISTDDYILVINGCEELVKTTRSVLDNFRGKRTSVFNFANVVSEKSRIQLTKLKENWNLGIFRANHPPSEYHCFARWLVLHDLYASNFLSRDDVTFSHDWDDLMLAKPFILKEKVLNWLNKHNISARSDCIFIPCSSYSNYPLFTHLQPHFLITNFASISCFNSCLDRLLNRRPPSWTKKGLFADMNVWGYTVSRMLSSRNIFCLFKQIHEILDNSYFVCDNVRSFDNPSGIIPKALKIFIPPEINYLDDGETHLRFIRIRISDKLYIQTQSQDIPLMNLHFQGVEGKYLCNKLTPILQSFVIQNKLEAQEYWKNNKD